MGVSIKPFGRGIALFLGVLILLWSGLSCLLVGSRGDPESLLESAFRGVSRADAFNGVNRPFILFWLNHSVLSLFAFVAARLRRLDVFAVLLIGPAFALAIILPGKPWSDPNWYDILLTCDIGWMVGVVVAGAYWGRRGGSRLAATTKPPDEGSA